MLYKIHHEPLYSNECIAVLKHVIGGTSIKDEMEETLARRGESLRCVIEPLYQMSLTLERQIKKYIVTDDAAVFLFSRWENAASFPVDAVYSYDMFLSGGIDNKAIPIFYMITENLPEGVWGIEDLENGNPPPNIDDATFFRLIDQTGLSEEGKMKAMKLYYDFASYRSLTHTLLKQCEDIFKEGVRKHNKDARLFMDSIEKKIQGDGVRFFKENFGITPDENTQYQIYPGIYQSNAFIINVSGLFPPYILLGLNVLKLKKSYDNAELTQGRAAQFLKLLSDETKQSILLLLKKEPLYGSQLAEKLNCTAANISHHTSTLLNFGVIRLSRENNRVYFILNRDAIWKYLDAAKEMFM